jgi:hypothetical protein
MDTIQLIFSQLPPLAIIETSIFGNNATITIYESIPCRPDIYCVFRDADNSLYALQNTGAQYRLSIKYIEQGLEKIIYFPMPITNFLLENREDCIEAFVKHCGFDELGTIPIRKEQFVTSFIPPQFIEGLLANYA